MIWLVIILCVLLMVTIILSVWGYMLLSRKFNYVYNNHEIIYLKTLETEIMTVIMYLNMLKKAYHEAVRKEKYKAAGVINDTLKHNLRTLQELREECETIQRKRQSPR